MTDVMITEEVLETVAVEERFEVIESGEHVTVSVVEPDVLVVTAGVPGPQGVQGPVGPAGPQGPAGVDATEVFEQLVASAIWTINHSLWKRPSVTVVDSAGTVVEGRMSYPSDTQVVVEFLNAFSGFAYLN